MTQFAGPFSSGAGANFTDGQWQKFFGAMFTDGIALGVDNQLAVTPGSGMQVLVDTGMLIGKGLLFTNDASVPLTIAAADSTNPRYDLVVVHFDLSAKTGTLQVLTGTPAPSPSYPTLTQSSSVWEVQVARVLIPAGSSSISSGNIGFANGPDYATPNILYGQKKAMSQDWFLAGLSNNVYMTPNHVFPGGAAAPTKIYPMDHLAATTALEGTEWHLEGMHGGSRVDLIKAVSGVAGGRCTIDFKNMKIILGTGNQTGVAHGLGVQPDIIIVSPINSSPVNWSVFNIGATTFDVHVSITDTPWVALAIKLG